MNKLVKILLLLLTAALLLTACKKDAGPEDTPEPAGDDTPAVLETFTFTRETFPRMDGTLSTTPLGQAIAGTLLGDTRENAEKLAMFTGSAQALRNLANSLCDIIIIGEPSPDAIDEVSKRDFGYDMAPIATDALVFIVSASNPVSNLTSAQVRAIYSGEITEWQQVGGNDLDIIAYQRNEEATSQVLMEKLVMDWEKMANAPMQSIASRYYMDDEPLTAIKGFDYSVNAIGYTMYYYAANMGAADGCKILSVDGVMPTAETISSGAYPFLNPYYAVISKDLPEDDNARILYNWLLSDEGQALIGAEGYVPIKVSQVLGDIPPVTPPQMRWNIASDGSKLTPYNSLYPLSSMPGSTALPELVPSDSYGRLLPYSTAVTMNDGGIHAVKFGFVTEKGVVVTAPIYDDITGAIYSAQAGDARKSAYRLHMNLPEDDPNYGYQTIQAACAGDGSWVTDLKYANIIFRRDVIFLTYNDDTFDIDVYDYNGNFLYNILDTEWIDRISEDTWPDYFIYGEGEGFSFIHLDDGTCAVVELLSGELYETGYRNAFRFSDGLVSVIPADSEGLWGFADVNHELVIPAEYSHESAFINGRAIVETPGGMQHVINKQGGILFSVEDGYIISTLPDNYGYALYTLGEYTLPQYYTYDFERIVYPDDVESLGPESGVTYMYGGWFSCITENGIRLFTDAAGVFTLPSFVHHLNNHSGGLVTYVEYDSDGGKQRTGAMSVDGTVIIPAHEDQSVSLYTLPDNTWFAVNINTAVSDSDGVISDTYIQSVYSLFSYAGSNVREEKTGLGILSYDAALGLFAVQASDHFTWINTDGSTLVKIPSLAYSFD